MLLVFAVKTRAAESTVSSYRKIALHDTFYSEGATFGDLDKDGNLDAVAGPYWWSGPDFKARHEIYPALPFDPLNYSDNFLTFVHDFNADGWNDVLVLGYPGVDASWYRNPGAKGGLWRRHVVFLPVDNESPTFGDLLGDGKPPVLLCMTRGRIGYATWSAKDPVLPWVFHPITPQGIWTRFTHGLGFGDLNGDGRNDVVEKDGWWEQPASLVGDPVWKKHVFAFAGVDPDARGGAQMLVTDVDNDGKNDVITAINAHGFGLSWWQQIRGDGGETSFRERRITSREERERLGGIQFGQPHALALADFDRDGLPDLVTGKRWWAHGPKGDVQPNAAPVVIVFLLRRSAAGEATFVPHLIDETTGVGTQVTAADVNGDGFPDVVVGNKRGAAVLLSQKP